MKKEMKALKKQVKATATRLDIISLIALSKFSEPEKVGRFGPTSEPEPERLSITRLIGA